MKILLVRGKKVMLDSDLAQLYGVFEAIKKLLEPPEEPPKPRFGMN